MKCYSPLSLALALIALNATAISGHAEQAGRASSNQLQAKIEYCETCHGINGRGFRGAYPMPRLAGQQTEYLENQLRAFVERRRISPTRLNDAHVLSPAMLKDVSSHFKQSDPKPKGNVPKHLVDAGKKIYEEGVPGANVAPCASCHGPDAKGDGSIPRLGGQLHDYTAQKLMNWDKERGQDRNKLEASATMEQIARGLTAQQISAVAAYLNSLE